MRVGVGGRDRIRDRKSDSDREKNRVRRRLKCGFSNTTRLVVEPIVLVQTGIGDRTRIHRRNSRDNRSGTNRN